MDFNHLLFSLEGRISRQPFWVGTAIVVLASLVLTLALGHLFGVSPDEMIAKKRSVKAAKLDFLVNLIMFWPGFAITVKRLHDRDRNSTTAVLLYALFAVASAMEVFGLNGSPQAPSMTYLGVVLTMVGIGLWMLVDLGFLKGSQGNNQYGPDPLTANQATSKD